MNRSSRAKPAVAVMLLGGFLVASPGCDEELAGALLTLSGDYLGDVVSVAVVHRLQDAIGIEDLGEGASDEHEHEHETSALHDHEH